MKGMKALSLAVVALAGFGMAGAAFGQTCPSIAPGNASPGGGGAWTSQTQNSGVLIIDSPGLDASSCKLGSSLNAGANAFSAATVTFQDTTDETTYRAQFLINADAVTGLGSFDGAQVFTANANTAAPGTNPTLQVLKLAIVGNGAGKNLTIIAACNNGGSNKCSASAPLTAGVNRVEIQVSIGGGTSGFVKYWVNNTTEATPTGSIASIDNSPWVGVRKVIMGLASPTRNYANGGHVAYFDSFDSRRQTFIGG